MKNRRRIWLHLLYVMGSLMSYQLSIAEDGVKDTEIVIGSSLPLEGHASFLGTQLLHGTKAYLNSVNEKGGINNRIIKLVAYNDDYDRTKCEENTKKLIEQDKVFMLTDYVGTGTTLQALPLIQKAHIPMLGLFTGAEVFRQPVIKEVFNIRSSDLQETQTVISRFWNDLEVRKIAVLYQDSPYGESGLKGVETALDKLGSKPVAIASYERGTDAIGEALKTIRAAQPDAVIMAGTYTPTARFVFSSKWSGFDPFFHSLSFVGADELAKLIGQGDSDGVIVTQVVPPQSTKCSAVQEYREILKKSYPSDEPNFVSMEGFVNAKVLIAILSKMGQDISRERFIATAEGIKDLDIGLDHTISFAPDNHQGSDTVYATVIKNGVYATISDEEWKAMKKRNNLNEDWKAIKKQ
jgi:branched-chain amino acid transport system substrate-binding protein